MNGSQPYGPPGNPGPLRRIHLRGAAQRFLSPHPDPLPEEREQRARHSGKPTRVDYSPNGEGFTLSRGEVSVYRSADFQSAVSPICNRQGTGESQVSRFCRRSAGYKPAIQQTTSLRYECRQHGKQMRGERAGVRGNGAKSLLAYRTNPRIVELGESSGIARGFPECS
jgi:hypothetical protein